MSPRPPMRPHNIRIPDKLWTEAQTKADQRDENLSEVIRAALERYVKSK